ncbi:MAG: hypothetical protein Q9163_003517 [Psora crenata]
MRRPNNNYRRKSSTIHYQTFPTTPPKSKGRPPSDTSSNDGYGHNCASSHGSHNDETPLPIRQLCILAIISLAEQTALNSIGPYLPQMTSTFPEVRPGRVGLYVGTIASSFALAQFATNFFWGWLSDRIGRKPVILTGTLLTAACFIAFGFVRTLWQAVLVQVLMGLVNGNQGLVSTCLGEITDRSNQSRAFTYLPVIYGLGGITGPVLGGLLVNADANSSQHELYPYIRPNLVSAGVLLVDLIIAMIFLEESLEEARELPPLGKRVGNLFSWVWQFAISSRPSYLRIPDSVHKNTQGGDASMDDNDEDDDTDSDLRSDASIPELLPRHHTNLTSAQILNRDTVLLMSTYLIFQLSNVSYNALYPVFGQAAPPRGRNLSPEEIGISLAFAGAMTIVFQLGFFGKARAKVGNKATYRVCLAGIALAFILTPWVGYKDMGKGDGGISSGKAWLWIELGFVLLLKSLAAVGCLTSFLLLITNSAPTHSVLGTLNGIAQTLSAAGRASGPFLAGALFSLSTHVDPKGEAVTFGVFAGVAFIGLLLSFGIRGEELESEGFDEEIGGEISDDNDEDEDTMR